MGFCQKLPNQLTLNPHRNIIAYRHYFLKFYEEQTEAVQLKIEWILNLIRVTPHVPKKYFDHLTGTPGLYEIRIEFGGDIYRIFSFFDKGNLIVLGNAFQKKTRKTPGREIEKALRIMKEYRNEKDNQKNHHVH